MSEIKVYIPFTKAQDATIISTWDYDPIKVDTSKTGYSQYFKDRWNDRETFINIEQDVVIWDGAIESLINCSQPWCLYDYKSEPWDYNMLRSVHLGCTKITSSLIEKTKEIWDDEIEWDKCDIHLFREAREAGIRPHQHFPAVTNANPAFLARRRI